MEFQIIMFTRYSELKLDASFLIPENQTPFARGKNLYVYDGYFELIGRGL